MSSIIAGYNGPVDEQQIRELIDYMNNAWLQGAIEELPAALDTCFHDQMTIRGADLQIASAGKDACIQSYLDFVSQAAIRECTLEEPSIDLAGDSAVAVYSWDMTYDMDGQTYEESGTDVLMLARVLGRWLITWRAMLPNTAD